MNVKGSAVGVFADRSHAEYAIEELRRHGFMADQIGVLIPDAAEGVEPPSSHLEHTKAGAGAAMGAATGAALGGMAGVAVVGTFIPGVGPVLSSGMLASALGGALSGLLGGGVVGALIGMEIPEEEAHEHARHFHSGRTIVTVRAGERFEEATEILRRAAQTAMVSGHAHLPGRMARLPETEGDSAPGAGTVGAPLP